MVHAGQLLVASPGMHNAVFDRTVILLLDHDEDGSMGLVLNRPSGLTVLDALPELSKYAEPDLIFLGGPVEEGTALVLAEPIDPAAELHYMRDGIGLIDLTDSRSFDAEHSLRRLRVYSGYAGWGPAQLDEELKTGAWVVADADEDDAWHVDSDTLWARILGRQNGLTRFLADYPDAPWLN